MNRGKLRKYLLILFLALWAGTLLSYLYQKKILKRASSKPQIRCIENASLDKLTGEAFKLLSRRKDSLALQDFQLVLSAQPNNLEALWGKAEVLRRTRKFREAEEILTNILKQNQQHIPSLISLSYIRYKDYQLNAATNLINRALKSDCLNNDNGALAYMMLGTINAQRSSQGGIFSKIRFGTQVKYYLEKAKKLSPQLPEVHLALGTFFLKAPKIAGGNIEKAKAELKQALKLAPDFATANARLAQVYQKMGDTEQYNFYLERTRELDPENEVLGEIE